MADRLRNLWALPLAAGMLLWPAIWNGYPIVFADTGTYLSQAVHRYAGWDRPVFYSLFMLPLHATVSVWPVVAAQALLTAWLLRMACRVIAPSLRDWEFVALVSGLAAFTWLPWLVSELMPDIFTPLVVLGLALLPRVARQQRWAMLPLTAFMIATQQSSVLLSFVMAMVGLVGDRLAAGGVASLLVTARLVRATQTNAVPRQVPRTGRAVTLNWGLSGAVSAVWTRVNQAARAWAITQGPGVRLAPPALAVLALCSANLLAHGRFALSPYGNVFLLARVIYDGPGADVLRGQCPSARWRLCQFADRLPPQSDDFLWTPASPLNLAGGPKALAPEAGAIVSAAIAAEPFEQAAAAIRNMLEQMRRFASGDGLNAWPTQVTPWIERDFPPGEAARYAAARQQNGNLSVPWPLGIVQPAAGLVGVAFCLALLPGALRDRSGAAALLIAVLLSLPVSAAVTGALSGPHDRYQARIMWLPPFAAALCAARRRT